MIMKLRCGLLTDRQAADRMGVSRKTFYKWEKRGLNALLDNVTDLPPVRRAHPLDNRILDLEKQLALAHREIDLLNRKMALKDVLMELKLPETSSDRAKKNKRICQAVAMIEEMKTTFSLSYACLANLAGLGYRTLMRWKRRLASELPPVASGSPPCGEAVAGHLAQLFDRFGPPLFCKRDNSGNLNQTTVNEVLENAWVIPINNPPKMVSYNGAIERTQREFKDFI
jgi:DNA-binding transcriptional regulator YiaG